MRLLEVKQRLRRIADEHQAPRLPPVPVPRNGGQPTPTFRTYEDVSADKYGADGVRHNSIALAAGAYVPRRPSGPAAPTDATLPIRAVPVAPRRGRQIRHAAAAVATAMVFVVGVAAFAANGGSWPRFDDDRPVAVNAAAPVPVGSASQPSTVASTLPSTVLPAGFKWYESRSGFRVAWPAKWVKVGESRTSVTLCAPGGPPVVTVREWTPSDPDLSAALRHEEAAAELPRYQRVKMVVSAHQESAEWEYTFTDAKMGALHGLERAVIVQGRTYLIQWRTPAGEWAAHLPGLGIVTDSFRTTT